MKTPGVILYNSIFGKYSAIHDECSFLIVIIMSRKSEYEKFSYSTFLAGRCTGVPGYNPVKYNY